MASLSISPAFESLPASGSSRHARRHSRHPTAAAPLPAFSFNTSTASHAMDATSNDKEEDDSNTATDHVRRPSKPAPLPDFTFNPGAEIPVQRTPSPTHPILEEMALNQQRAKSAAPAPLSAFTFKPAVVRGPSSPTKLEHDSEPPKGNIHKRADSEFVGGKAQGAQLLDMSPVKHEPKPSGPPVTGSGYKPQHLHRRSQAISMSDIDTSDLIKQHALAKARAPPSPSTPQDNGFSFTRASPAHRQTPSTSRSPPGSPRRRESASSYKPRTVDFSDRVDVIPRPLSMISSETERSSSTVRGHSRPNSITSIASLGTPLQASPFEFPEHDSPTPSHAALSRRPNTADACLFLSGSATKNDHNLLTMPKRPLSASDSPIVTSSGSPPLKKKQHFWSTHGNDPSPTPTPRAEEADPFEEDKPMTPQPIEAPSQRPKTAPERPAIKKRQKYHTWTAGIFSKKTKHRPTKKSMHSPTPPPALRGEGDKVDEIFDTDDTVVLREVSPVSARRQPSLEERFPTPTPRHVPVETSGPVIDLDAVLEQPDEDGGLSDDHARKTTARIAKLHSSERRGVIDAFGVSHRRTESAPALSPVNRSALFSMRHQASNPSLSEEVFDEEEEDNFLAHEEEAKHVLVEEPVSGQPQRAEVEQENGLGLTNLSSHVDGVIILDSDNEGGAEDVKSSKSTLEAPAVGLDGLPKRPSTSPMAFAYPDPQLHYASSTEGRATSASLISSPDADHLSFDIQSRPRRLGELNVDTIRPSTDDLPSLSDSISSAVIPRGSLNDNVRPSLEKRSHSMFVPGSSRPNEGWKRSSLASFTRLIPGSAHGSKVKLETVSAEGEDTTKKKDNRINRLMHFWRKKEAGGRPTTSSR